MIVNGTHPLVMTNSLLLNMAIEIVDLPSYNMVIFHSYVSLPEGHCCHMFHGSMMAKPNKSVLKCQVIHVSWLIFTMVQQSSGRNK